MVRKERNTKVQKIFKKTILFAAIAIYFNVSLSSLAHSGRTDANGGHYNRKTGEYHYHNGGSSSSSSDTYNTPETEPKKDIISIKNSPSKMTIGENIMPEYEIESDSSGVQYSVASDNSSVVKVDSKGKLSAISAGEATITVQTDNNSKQFTIIVSEVPVESIIFKEEEIQIQLGEKLHLQPEILPADASNKKIIYNSKDSSIVSCKSNKIKGLKVGKTTITATTSNNKEAKLQVEVFEQMPETIEVEEELHILVGERAKVNVNILPENANNKSYEIKSDDKIISIENNNEVVALQEGNATVVITTHNNIIKEIPVEVSYIPVENIIINDSDNILLMDEIDIHTELDLKVEIEPANATYKKYEISSSDAEIIKIENNRLVIVGEGNVVLSVEAHGGKTKDISLKIVDKNKKAKSRFSIILVIAGLIGIGTWQIKKSKKN